MTDLELQTKVPVLVIAGVDYYIGNHIQVGRVEGNLTSLDREKFWITDYSGVLHRYHLDNFSDIKLFTESTFTSRAPFVAAEK